jgi:G3E family GTPase
VVDASTLAADLASFDRLADRGAAAAPGDARTVADLIVDQIEFADMLLLNKCDLLPEVGGIHLMY